MFTVGYYPLFSFYKELRYWGLTYVLRGRSEIWTQEPGSRSCSVSAYITVCLMIWAPPHFLYPFYRGGSGNRQLPNYLLKFTVLQPTLQARLLTPSHSMFFPWTTLLSRGHLGRYTSPTLCLPFQHTTDIYTHSPPPSRHSDIFVAGLATTFFEKHPAIALHQITLFYL